jgi:hypothetical protein
MLYIYNLRSATLTIFFSKVNFQLMCQSWIRFTILKNVSSSHDQIRTHHLWTNFGGKKNWEIEYFSYNIFTLRQIGQNVESRFLVCVQLWKACRGEFLATLAPPLCLLGRGCSWGWLHGLHPMSGSGERHFSRLTSGWTIVLRSPTHGCLETDYNCFFFSCDRSFTYTKNVRPFFFSFCVTALSPSTHAPLIPPLSHLYNKNQFF